ncbi:hypothetical protein [Mesoterricola silvestris]|uniref:Uncharacterized protein n=1 Tax=Mesoterricola silvestris TaxID=2927979 RepID=A0AA48K9W2_9BACT|nr:hypothetical protein [Mesoterricola silvestris]BDU72727.1 hypothetical protein METEAL_19010 [Mesoterricola silvestris]
MNTPNELNGPGTREEALLRLEGARRQARLDLEADPARSAAFGEQVPKLRLAGMPGSNHNPKAAGRIIAAAGDEGRWFLALLGPEEGLAKVITEFLPQFGLDPERRFLAALACAGVEPAKTLERLDQAALGSLDAKLAVVLVALAKHPALDFEEQKKIEILYHSGGDEGAQDLQRRFEQARSRSQAHVRHHLLKLVPEAVRQDPGAYHQVLLSLLRTDPYGTLECMRDPELAPPFRDIPQATRLDLLDTVASFGLGFASNYLDLFAIEDTPESRGRLQAAFAQDLTAGSSIYGAYALEGVQNYPFGLGKIEPVFPRRISNPEALAYLRKDDAVSVMPRTYSAVEVGNAVNLLQEREVLRFLEMLKADIFLSWKSQYSENKRAVVFGDLDLKIRNILFLLAHATFRDNAYFDDLLAFIAATHPSTAGNEAQLHLLANRHFFLEVLGINPGLLFNSPQRGAAALRAPIEEVKNFRILYLLHLAMSIHLHVGDTLFRNVPIAWNILQKQGDGLLDTAMQEVLGFFDTLDTLLVLGKPVVPDLRAWLPVITDALTQALPELPLEPGEPGRMPSLRLLTRDAVARHRELLNAYCLQVLREGAARAGVGVTNAIQNLRLPRTKTDKLFALLEEDRKR